VRCGSLRLHRSVFFATPPPPSFPKPNAAPWRKCATSSLLEIARLPDSPRSSDVTADFEISHGSMLGTERLLGCWRLSVAPPCCLLSAQISEAISPPNRLVSELERTLMALM